MDLQTKNTSKATINTPTSQLLKTLKQVKGAVNEKTPKGIATSCEITIIDNKVAFAVPGAVFSMPCTTQGTCKATVPFLHFLEIIKSLKEPELEITITNGKITLGGITISAHTTFFQNDLILRTIDLPINYNDSDLLRLTKENYTPKEFRFNRLTSNIKLAKKNLQINLKTAHGKLKAYGVPFEELEKFVESYVFRNDS